MMNRYLLEKILAKKTASKANANKKSIEHIVEKYDTVYVNGFINS